MAGLRHQPAKEAALPLTEHTKSRDVLARARSIADVNQLGRETGQAKRLRTVTPRRLFLAVVSAQGGAQLESLHAGCHADLEVACVRGRRVARFRVVVVPGRDEAMTRLCTNLPRTPFSAPLK
jgi:hypothetical protein